MVVPEKLFRTTIHIWTEYDPTNSVEIDDLAREAMTGEGYCSLQETELVTDPDKFPNTEFFDDGE